MLVTGSQSIKFLSQPLPHFFREDLFVQKLFEYGFLSELDNQIDRITGQFGFNNKKASVDGTINNFLTYFCFDIVELIIEQGKNK